MPRSSLAILVLLTAAICASASAAPADLPDHPLTLAECVDLALTFSPSLELASQDVRSAQAGLTRSRASYYPSALFIGTRGRTGGTSFLDTATGAIPFSTATQRREAEVLLSQLIWDTGRNDSVRSSRHSLTASLAREQAAVQDLVLAVAQRYYAALAAEQLVQVAEADLAAARDHEKLVRARVEVGEAPPVDTAPAEANVAAAEFTLLQDQNNADLAKAQLKREIGIPPTYPLQLAPPNGSFAETSAPSQEESLDVAHRNRPDLLGTRQSVLAAERDLRLAESSRWGRLGLSAEYDIGLAGARRDTDSWALLLSATGVLFDGGARRAEVEAARSRLASLKAQEQALLNQVGLEVESALLTVETARKSVQAAQKAVASAETRLAGAEAKYREGVGIFVEILDAQEQLARARANHVQAVYDYRTSLVALERATGTLTPTCPRGGLP